MPPTTRWNKAKLQKLLSSGIAVNSRGFAALPNELYLEILGFLPARRLLCDVWYRTDPYRQLTLYSLSQTCQSLRYFFLKYAWERIEVFGGMWTPKGRLVTKSEREKRGKERQNLCDKMMVEETLRQLETVTLRNPDLRQNVSIVSLVIVSYASESVLSEIAQNLTLFPNLHTLQLVFRFSLPHSQSVFSEFCYPSINTLNLGRLGPHKDILRACMNASSFYRDAAKRSLPLFAKRIEKLGVVRDAHLPDIVKHFPRLYDLSLSWEFLRKYKATLDSLSRLPLHTIRLRLDVTPRHLRGTSFPITVKNRRKLIDVLKGILAKCRQTEMAKKVIVVTHRRKVVVYSV